VVGKESKVWSVVQAGSGTLEGFSIGLVREKIACDHDERRH